MNTLYKYFISGFLFLIPLWIVWIVIRVISGIVTDIVKVNVLIVFLLSAIVIILLGFIAQHIFKQHIHRRLHHLSERPGMVGFFTRALLEIGQMTEKARGAFHNPILFKVDDGIYKLGFITDHDIDIIHPLFTDITQHPE